MFADDAERPVAQLDALVVVVCDDLERDLDADHAVGLRCAAVDLRDRLRERLAYADVPIAFRGSPIAFVTAGILSLAFMAFTGFARL